jgi:hypothetical protein
MPEVTTTLKTTNAATSITKHIDRVLIIQGGLTASLSDNQNGGAACWRLIVLLIAYHFAEQVFYSIRGDTRVLS